MTTGTLTRPAAEPYRPCPGTHHPTCKSCALYKHNHPERLSTPAYGWLFPPINFLSGKCPEKVPM